MTQIKLLKKRNRMYKRFNTLNLINDTLDNLKKISEFKDVAI